MYNNIIIIIILILLYLYECKKEDYTSIIKKEPFIKLPDTLVNGPEIRVFIGLLDKYFLCSSITSILFLKELGLSLHKITQIISKPLKLFIY